MSEPTITLRAECLCRTHSFTTAIPLSELPLQGSACHCTSCRHVTGALRSSDAVWPGPASDIAKALAAIKNNNNSPEGDGSGTLKRYRHSARVNVVFCGICGSGMFFEEFEEAGKDEDESVRGVAGMGEGWAARQDRREGKNYLVFTGTLKVEGDVRGRQVVRCEDHIFVGDTVDGGSVNWLRGLNQDGKGEGEQVAVWLGNRNKSEEVKEGEYWPAVKELQKGYEANLKAAEGGKGNVPIRCHCGGVDLVLRAGEAQREFEEMQRKGEQLPWFVDPATHKLLGSLDCCDSCRIWAGSEVYNWTFSLLKHISFAGADRTGFPGNTSELRAAVEGKHGKPRDARLGTLAIYASSSDVQRYHCGRCSASVFYAVDERPDMVDIAVGLLYAADGARAESVLSWAFGGPFSWKQDMAGTWREGFLKAVERDSEKWRIERGYPKNWRRVTSEQAEQAAQK
ncbi:hypothetical protein VTI74DRAFT_5179 [Chaetomium olivicolor]